MKSKISFITLFLSLLLFVGCVSDKDTEKGVDKNETQDVSKNETYDIPSYAKRFVSEADFKQIDWNRMVTKIGSNGQSDILGNPNKVGFISGLGPEIEAKKLDKWLWHFYGIEQGKLTVIGYHQETKKKEPILNNSWTIAEITGSKNTGDSNGADATTVSNVLFSKSGKWALLVYIDEELYDTLVFDVK